MSSPATAPVGYGLGAMYWPNPHATDIQLDDDLRRIRAHGFPLIRAFVWWEEVEAEEGRFDFALHDRLYAAAARHGLRIAQSFGLYPPRWMGARLKAAGLHTTDRYQCLDNPDLAAAFSRYLTAVVARYASHPAQGMWILWNEAGKRPCACPHTAAKYRGWLRARYGTIERLRAAWTREHMVFNSSCARLSFEDIDPGPLVSAFIQEKRNYPEAFDWLDFATDNLAENVKWIADQVRALDPHHPIHTNLNCLTSNGVSQSVDLWKIGRSLDSIGASVHSCWAFGRLPEKDHPAAYAFVIDLLVSSTKGRRPWISELQAGANINSGHLPFSPTPEDIKAWIAQAVAKGTEGLLFWLWQAWRSCWEAGEFSLVNGADGADTDRSRMAGAMGRLLERHRGPLAAAHRPAARVAILYSYPTLRLALREEKAGWPIKAVFGCYKALWRRNLAADFVTSEEIEAGILANYDVLYLPYAKVVNSATGAAIARFAEAGGGVWADGHCAFRDDHFFLHARSPGAGLDAVFGCREADLAAPRGPVRITIDDGFVAAGHLFEHQLEASTGRIVGTFADGKPAVVENSPGRGRALLIGTYLCLGYADHEDESAGRLIAGFALRQGVRPKAETHGPFVEVNRLEGPDADWIVATNHQDEAVETTLHFPAAYSHLHELWSDTATPAGHNPDGSTTLSLHFSARDTALWRAAKS